MGVLIHRRGLSEEEYRGERYSGHPRDVKGDPDLLNLTQPDVVAEIHDAYFGAGADIATTNTFTATRIGQADYGLEGAAAEMSLEGARLARRAADEWTARTPEKPRFVAGSVGPLNVTLSLSPRVEDAAYRGVTFDEVRGAYEEQIAALRDGGADLLLIETIFDTLNAKAAVVAARDVAPELPSGSRSRPSTRAGGISPARPRMPSGSRSSTPSRSSSASTARSARPRCGRSSSGSRTSPRRTSRAIRTRDSRTTSDSTTSSRATRAVFSGRSPRTVSSTSSEGAAGRHPSTRTRSSEPFPDSRRAACPLHRSCRASPGSIPS